MKIYSLDTIGRDHSFPIPMPSGGNRNIRFRKIHTSARQATFQTTDEELQDAIEASRAFASGRIKLVGGTSAEPSANEKAKAQAEVQAKLDAENAGTSGTGGDNDGNSEEAPVVEEVVEETTTDETAEETPAVEEEASTEESPASKVHPEVKNWQEAAVVLRTTYGVAHQALRGEAAIMRQAETLGVSFPNAK